MVQFKIGIDTTNNNLCYALLQDNDILFSENIYPCSNAAEILAPKISAMLKKHHIVHKDITDIVSVTGPGGFSGVRIGTAFVTGFIANSEIRVIGMTSLESLGLSVINPQPNSIIIACLNARREGVYIAIFNHEYKRLTPDSVIDITDLPDFLNAYQAQPFYISGHGMDIIKSLLPHHLLIDITAYPLAQEFTKKAHNIRIPHNNQPIYLRMPDAKLAQKR